MTPPGKKCAEAQSIGKLREAEVDLPRGKTVLDMVHKIGVMGENL
jgi:hypothetical protein